MGKESKFTSYVKVNIKTSSHFIKALIWTARLSTISLCAQVSNCLSPWSPLLKRTADCKTPTFVDIKMPALFFYWTFGHLQSKSFQGDWRVIFMTISYNLSHNISSLRTPPVNRENAPGYRKQGIRLLATESSLLVTGSPVPSHKAIGKHF